MSEGTEKAPRAEREAMLAKRDAETQTMLGIFVTVLSVPVLIGTAWAENYRQMAVNLAAGLVLLGIGVAVLVWGRVMAKRIKAG